MKMKLLAITFGLLFVLTGNLYAFSIPGAANSVDYLNSVNGFNNNDSVGLLNADDIFGFNDWVKIQKYEVDGGLEMPQAYDYGLTVSADPAEIKDLIWKTGTWSFDRGLWADYSDVMIVLKAARDFTAFLLSSDVSSGTWSSPDHALSHLTVYARGDSAPVPEPSTLLLLGAGIAGLAVYRRKKN